jgi:hypothetical protein
LEQLVEDKDNELLKAFRNRGDGDVPGLSGGGFACSPGTLNGPDGFGGVDGDVDLAIEQLDDAGYDVLDVGVGLSGTLTLALREHRQGCVFAIDPRGLATSLPWQLLQGQGLRSSYWLLPGLRRGTVLAISPRSPSPFPRKAFAPRWHDVPAHPPRYFATFSYLAPHIQKMLDRSSIRADALPRSYRTRYRSEFKRVQTTQASFYYFYDTFMMKSRYGYRVKDKLFQTVECRF